MGSNETLPDNFGKGGWKICFKIEPPATLGNGMLKISFHSDYNRKPHPDDIVEETIKDMWKRRKETVIPLFTHKGSGSLASPLTFFQSPEEGAPERHLPLSLGNAGIVLTSDNFIILLERSEQVGEGVGRWVLPGGHPEPSHRHVPNH
ncbi:Nudix hydrolase 9 [Galdieria sulphuraria]|nr:Nudix hydrolase 9 [Galdieria sulphuraria]